jgi:hypothetical protein
MLASHHLMRLASSTIDDNRKDDLTIIQALQRVIRNPTHSTLLARVKPMSSHSLRLFLSSLFVQNEQQHMTDEQLENEVRQFILDNLPTEKLLVLDNLPSTCKSRIRIWRSEYNRGLWLPIPQKVFSFRYGPSGKPINRNGNPLSPIEIELSRKKHAGTVKKAQRSSSAGA